MIEAALDELDARRALDGDVKKLAHFAGAHGQKTIWQSGKLVLAFLDGCSVTHNAGERG